MSIKIPENYMGKPIKGSLEKVLASAPTPEKSTASSQANTNVQISNITDFWQISGVEYRNGIYSVDLAKSLLDNGNAKTQDEWANYSEKAALQDEFRTPDYPSLYGIVKALYNARNNPANSVAVAEAQKFLKDTSRARWLMTLSRIDYHSNNKDTIIHNHGTRWKHEVNVDFVGPDGYITDTRNIVPYQCLLGTNDEAEEIKNVFEWINGTNTYMWRVNQKTDTTRVARFYADSDGANLYCYWNPSSTDSSLGVRFGAAGTASTQK